MKNILFYALILITLFACTPNKAEHVERAFYYWKNDEWQPTNKEDSLVRTLGIKKLYVKFFEVERNEVMGNIPTAKTQLHLYNAYDSITMVPTIYLRNEVFKKISNKGLDSLAGNVSFLINKYCTDNGYYRGLNRVVNVSEYQMDCDWTPSTKDNYFYFLKKLKKISGKQISCTLRLYPYKYPDKMGIPPVDKAMLMCYNLISPLEDHTKNSILDINELSLYLKSADKYPLHLDIALPLYSWVQVYQNNHFAKLLYTDTKNIKAILKHEKPLWYEATRDTVINDFYLRTGDKIKIEETTPAQIQEAIALIKKNTDLDKNITVSLFHLDQQQLSRYSYEQISAFYSGFTK